MPSEVHGSELDRSHIKGKLHKIIFILTICNQRAKLNRMEIIPENRIKKAIPVDNPYSAKMESQISDLFPQ